MTRKPARAGARPALLACALAGLLAAAGCSSSSSSQPSWASALGQNVTVTAPAPVAPGNNSPGAAVEGIFSALSGQQYTAECTYVEPAAQALCKSQSAGASSSNQSSLKNAAIGYVAINGDQALVGSTGTFCVPNGTPKCFTNKNPAAILSSGKSFGTLWADANKASTKNVYGLAPCVKIGGKWYLHEPSS